MNETMQQLLDRLVPRLFELNQTSNLAYWQATTQGSPEEDARYAALKAELLKVYADRTLYADLQALRASGQVTDPLLARQLEMLYNDASAQQIDPSDIEEMVKRETEIESHFTSFRAEIDGRKVADNELSDLMIKETDSTQRYAVWAASKQIGAQVADKVIELVQFRNAIAQKLGYANYYSMSLTLQEIDEQELFDLLGELEQATNEPFAALKRELDEELAASYGIQPEEMRPWHYHDPFFQEAPSTGDIDLNKYFEDKDVVALSKTFFDSVGLEIQDILDRSDLYEREGKSQHAYCTDIDREGDTRMLCNVRPNEYWMATMLHELGHAVYDKFHDPQMPWVLRQPAHILTTEAIAMLFGRLTKEADWLTKIAGVPAAEAQQLEAVIRQQLTLQMLIFVRWGLVMVTFERAMYQNPEQDLNTLWYDCVERFQQIKRPEDRNAPDWAAKIHLGCAPVYYQNYILGELTASQLLGAMQRDLRITHLTGHPAVGDWLKTHVFRPGASKPWNGMIAAATGEPLSAKYFVEQFVK